MSLAGRHILLGVTGSIAAYKSAMLVRELVKAGAEVRVVMTPSACEFITPLTLATLSQSDVVLDMFPADRSKGTWHIHLALWADAMLIAPASANTIAKLAHGFADNALSSLALALRCPLVLAPAMDTDMFVHPATQDNVRILAGRGVTIVEPGAGELASGLSGPGRLPELPVLIGAVEKVLTTKRDLEGRSVLVTAGPTYEALDPVRFIGNRSSGKMGYALAAAAAERGAKVLLVSGPTVLATPAGVRRMDVESAQSMHDAVMEQAGTVDIAILAAAVADFAAEHVAETKIKKSDDNADGLTLRLRRTPDILRTLGQRSGKAGRVLVGFALETDREIENARRKLEEKGADFIVLNNPRIEGAAFGGDTNVATLLTRDGTVEELGLLDKKRLAHIILDRALALHTERVGG
ncbi:MAG TPA: bifunctional phosphopantothenoylcysteine decarboxylase/phosphopantothenate--cysteine ligase CoaBC [Bacteroidota bacterium]|nr:bifunctional phosphopantothenoylcysteine decarboxylase/phosphopantothenate--cysteine ligase CoaBC [Bacteroidota bacterium]